MTTPPSAERLSSSDQIPFDAGRVLAAFVLLHLVVWTALPVIFTCTLPVDVIEGVIWGQGWQLGYLHPPFQAWLLGAADWLAGYQRWVIYLLSQLLVATGFWAVWCLARLIVSPPGALISVLTLEGVLFFNLMTPNLFPDLIELPFWALATGSFYRALRFRRLHDWVLLGLWLAAAAYAKYVGAVLAAVMIGFILIEPQARRSWRTHGPYVSAGLCLLLLAPHLWWAAQHGFPTVHRFTYSAEPTGGFGERLAAVAGFAGGDLALVAMAGLLIVLLGGIQHGEKRVPLAGASTTFDHHFVATLALGPILLTLVAAAASGRVFRVHWGYAMWSLIGLFAVIFLVPTVQEAGLRRFGRAWAATFLFVALLYAGANTLAPYARGNLAWHLLDRFQEEAAFPSQELADQITRRWQEKVGEPLAFVIGSRWVAGNVSFFSTDHPLVLRDGSPADSPWIDMDELRQRGAVVVWDPVKDLKIGGRYPGWLADSGPQQRFPTMEIQSPIILSWNTGAAVPPLQVMWGILSPEDRQPQDRTVHSPAPPLRMEADRNE